MLKSFLSGFGQTLIQIQIWTNIIIRIRNTDSLYFIDIAQAQHHFSLSISCILTTNSSN
jgi:hypothetical protein